MNEKLSGILGICRKAGKLCYGFETVKNKTLYKQAYIVMLANDVSEKTQKETQFFCDKTNTPMFQLPIDMEGFISVIGVNTGIIAITDMALANKTRLLIDEQCNK
jgi:ribosomal protein L7Ae-like RNA K-turn-binding protein